MMISIYSEMIPYHFTVNWYDFYRIDIFHDFTAKNKINLSLYDIGQFVQSEAASFVGWLVVLGFTAL